MYRVTCKLYYNSSAISKLYYLRISITRRYQPYQRFEERQRTAVTAAKLEQVINTPRQ